MINFRNHHQQSKQKTLQKLHNLYSCEYCGDFDLESENIYLRDGKWCCERCREYLDIVNGALPAV